MERSCFPMANFFLAMFDSQRRLYERPGDWNRAEMCSEVINALDGQRRSLGIPSIYD